METIKHYLISLLLVLMAGFCMAQSNELSCKQWFDEGNAAYNEGYYEEALSKYNQIVDSGYESASLYYNMGNACYKAKDYPNAIVYYEKALKLDPGNEDVRANLEIANMAIVDKIEPIPQSFLLRWWNSLKSLFAVDGWAWLSVISFAMVLLCLFLFLMARRRGLRKLGFFAGLVLVIVFALSIVFAMEKYHDLKVQDEAVVITPTVTVKSSPNVSSVDLFVLHEGSKVKILDATEEWNKIKIADGSVGWLQAKDVTPF